MSETIVTGSTSVVFPSVGYQTLSTLVHLLGCSVLSFCFARRLEWRSVGKCALSPLPHRAEEPISIRFLRFCTMALFLDSWLFVFSGGIVTNGIGMSLNDAACLSGVYLCIVL